ncbi:IPT/TIG domain-containing protein [Sphingobacterium sp. HMA12]|uniref:IPT/TIG domain-containing protein n=1 Tax=Sphingobacterium sp. HMA12 TaxID=2050894 RepID=UPI000CE9C3B9|nr:IPT/TIG domain-containing protein [Sphingobacterium sp. HMA12]
MKESYILWLVSLCFLFSCKKVEKVVETIPDTNPIRIETLINDKANESTITFSGRILYLNDESILDHGFVIEYQNYYDTRIRELAYPLGPKVTTGKITHSIQTPSEILNANSIKYYYYIRTEKGIYKGESTSLLFYWHDIDYRDDIIASPDDKITINGNFEKIKDKYTLNINDDNNRQEIPFTLGKDLKTLVFQMPANQTHGNRVSFVLQNKIHPSGLYGSTMLATVKVIGKLNEPTNYNFMYNDKITLTGPGIGSVMKEPFYILFGNRSFPYEPEMNLIHLTYGQPADNYTLGYFNGKDTVIFKQRIQIKQPLPSGLYFNDAEFHPGSTGNFSGVDFSAFGQQDLTTYKVGNKNAYVSSNWTGIHKLTIGDLPEGEYALSASSPFFKFTSQAKLRVKKLQVTGIEQNKGYYGNLVRINGNFRPNLSYQVKLGDQDASLVSLQNGQFSIVIPPIAAGTYPISIGYHGSEGKEYMDKTNLNLEILAPVFSDFYPKKGKAGDQITIVGKGIYFGMIYFGGRLVWRESGEEEIKFTIPRDITYKGKIEINLLFGDKWIKGKETFELI